MTTACLLYRVTLASFVVTSAPGQMRIPEPNPPFVSLRTEDLRQSETSVGPVATASHS